LNENQRDQNYFGILAFQKDTGDLNFQLAGFGRYSSVLFSPDPAGDLFFNGVASQVDREIYSTGLQGDLSYRLNDTHTLRAGVMALDEIAPTDTTTTVFALDGAGNPTGAPFPIVDNNTVNAQFYGVYLQDEWKITPKFTLNYGARADLYSSAGDESQISPRINAIYKLSDATTLHAGYARYFTPPPLESVNSASIASFAGTSNAAAVAENDPLKAERSDYFDAGITQKLTTAWQVGLDGYYKIAKDQLDDGFFGQSLIPSAFNYRKGKVEGLELTTNYDNGGFSAYANTAFSMAQGEDIESAQFLFDAADLAYIQNHWVNLDHDQTVTASGGVSYTWKHANGSSRVSLDALAGSGLRKDEVLPDGSIIPNGARVPTYCTLNLGVEEDFKLDSGGTLKARLDVVNVLDQIYELRDGTGIGVNAAQYGMRRGIFASLGCNF
jgi:outer membrane receptor protein involved in Fe transport